MEVELRKMMVEALMTVTDSQDTGNGAPNHPKTDISIHYKTRERFIS